MSQDSQVSEPRAFIRFVTRNYGSDDGDDCMSGWEYEGSIGLFDSYVSALAESMGLWEEYCEYHRNKLPAFIND